MAHNRCLSGSEFAELQLAKAVCGRMRGRYVKIPRLFPLWVHCHRAQHKECKWSSSSFGHPFLVVQIFSIHSHCTWTIVISLLLCPLDLFGLAMNRHSLHYTQGCHYTVHPPSGDLILFCKSLLFAVPFVHSQYSSRGQEASTILVIP